MSSEQQQNQAQQQQEQPVECTDTSPKSGNNIAKQLEKVDNNIAYTSAAPFVEESPSAHWRAEKERRRIQENWQGITIEIPEGELSQCGLQIKNEESIQQTFKNCGTSPLGYGKDWQFFPKDDDEHDEKADRWL